MFQTWIYSIISVLIVSLISLFGVITFLVKKETLDKLLLLLVSFSAGALLGDSFIHLIPEAFETLGPSLTLSLSLLGGILAFFVLEKFIYWRHCHIPTSKNHPHPVAFMNLIGDGFHNFLDGMIVAGSYLVSIPLGIATTIAVIVHEIPQEIGDFGVLVYGGFSRFKAIFFNLLSGFLAVVGVIVAILISGKVEVFSQILVPFTAGGFIYIAASDLIPELHKETKPSKSLLQLIFLLAGIAIMLLLLLLG